MKLRNLSWKKKSDSRRRSLTISVTRSPLTENITASIDTIVREVSRMDDGGENVAKIQSLKADLNVLDNKIDDNLNRLYSQYICLTMSSKRS